MVIGYFEASVVQESMVVMEVALRLDLGVFVEKTRKSEGLRMYLGRLSNGLDFVVYERKEKS